MATLNRLPRYVAAVVLLLTIVPVAQARYSGGTGEPNDPYQIATAADLIVLGETPEDYDKHFVLTADIDMDPNLPGRKVFDKAVIAPEGNFSGVFDGNGHTISHLTIKGGALFGYLGLFFPYYSVGEVRGVGLVDVNITGSGSLVGGLVAVNTGTVTQCYSTGTVSGNESVGGLVGRVWGIRMGGHGTVSHCYSTVAVSGSSSVGGLVGETCEGCIVTQCYSTGTVSGNSFIGGLVGYNVGSIANSYSTGVVSGIGSDVGGLVGYSDYGNVTACFWDIQTSGQTESAGGTGKTTAEMQDIRTYPVAEWDFLGRNEDGLHEVWQMPPERGYPVLTAFSGYVLPHLPGMGSQEDPYLISDAEQLGAMIHYSQNAHYQLVASIDLSGICWSTSVIPSFDGIFDGNGYLISHLTVAGDSYLGLFGELGATAKVSNLGLEAVDVNGTGIEVGGLVGTNDGSITNCYSTGAVSGNEYVGGLVGESGWESSISNSHSTTKVDGGALVGGLVGRNWGGIIITSYGTGAVSGDTSVGGLVGENWAGIIITSHGAGAVTGNERVGGLVGYNQDGSIAMSYSTGTVTGYDQVGGLVGQNYEGSITDSSSNGTVIGNGCIGGLVGVNGGKGGNITNCYNTGTVTASENNVGGLVGYNGWEGSITTSYNTDGIYGNDLVGGLVGTNWGDITASYNNGMVSGNESVGGLVGFNYISISNSYSTGRISADVRVGGLVGYNYSGIVNMSLWDVQASGQTTSDGGTGLGTVEMQTATTFLEAGWDLVGETANGTEDIWKIDEGVGYPRLSWEKYSGGTGEPNDPYQIATAADLIALGETPEDYDKHFILTADIDLDPNLPGRKVFDKAVIAPATFLVTKGFRVSGAPFAGTLDGNSHVILRLTINGGGYLGLFGRLASGAEVRNLGVVDINVCNPYCTGPMVAHPQPGGGLAGSNDGSVSQCYSTGTVTIIGCGVQGGVGGLVGTNGGTLSLCYSACAVTGDVEVGGLVGYHNGGAVTQCYSTGAVSGAVSVGGLVGRNLSGEVSQCYSAGAVGGTGGNVGGLVGNAVDEWYGEPGIIHASFWDTQTSGQAESDGGTGLTSAEMQVASTFLEAGWDFVGETANGIEDTWWILEGQDYPRLWWELIPEN